MQLVISDVQNVPAQNVPVEQEKRNISVVYKTDY